MISWIKVFYIIVFGIIKIIIDFLCELNNKKLSLEAENCNEKMNLFFFFFIKKTNLFGSVMAFMAENFQLPFSIIAVEVIAAKKALQFAFDLGLSSIVLEGDSKITIDGLRREELGGNKQTDHNQHFYVVS